MEKEKSRNGLEVAVIGMSGRFPAANSIEEFWENLKNGIEAVSFFTGEELQQPEPALRSLDHPDYVKTNGGLLEDKEWFDALFFEYTPVEAEMMDPQVRVFHECVWWALEDAGYDPGTYKGLIGLYAGASNHFNWQLLSLMGGKVAETGGLAASLLNDKDFLCTRVSYRLNLKGPALAVQSACSTSLVAVHEAYQAILTGECDMAVAGGVSMFSNKSKGYIYQEGMIPSPDGHCRAFDARGKGTVPGSGVGVVVLKHLENAEAQGDYIYAVVKGTAINNDGARKGGFTAPSREGQSEVIIVAHQVAEVEPESITYIEAHGTGTPLGDPIEIEALKQAFNTDKKGFCAIGSVKTNVGHLDAAAGITGFIKTVLALKHRLIPPSLHFENPNPNIDFANSPFYVNTTPRAWKNQDYPLRAGVSSFGIGGTNAHVILEEAPPISRQGSPAKSRQYQLVLLSAKTPAALDTITANLAKYLKKHPGVDLADVAYTLQVGRAPLNYRRSLVCPYSNQDSAIEGWVELLSDNGSGNLHTHAVKNEEKNIVFMFPGLGAQYVNMGRELYEKEPVFRREMDRCFGILKSLLGYDIKRILYPAETPTTPLKHEEKAAGEFEIAQVTLFIVEYALAKLLMHWGIRPQAMIGYSFGEYAAACISDIFSLEDGLRLVVARGKLLGAVPPGLMLSVPLPAGELLPLLSQHLDISLSIDNGASCIVGGPADAVKAFALEMKKKKYLCMPVPGDRAIHTAMMEPILAEFANQLDNITLNRPGIPLISNLTGQWLAMEEAVDPGYWVQHLRQTVCFAQGIRELVKNPQTIFIEIGPGRDLSTMVARHLDNSTGQQAVTLVRPQGKKVSDHYYLLNKIGWLWLYGVTIDWAGFYSYEKRSRVPLPGYPFERQRFWIEADPLEIGAEKISGQAGQPPKDLADWFSIPSWTRAPLLSRGKQKEQEQRCWLVFLDEAGIGALFVEQLKQEKQEVIVVSIGAGFEKIRNNAYTVNPGQRNDYQLLFRDLASLYRLPGRIIHFWNVWQIEGREKRPGLTWSEFEKTLDTGFYSLLYLAQELEEWRYKDKEEHMGIVEIGVVTNNMQEVTGGEGLYPEKSAILGLVKVIPQEQPGTRCKSVDILLPQPAKAPGTAEANLEKQQIINHLWREFSAGNVDTGGVPVVAFRGNRRQVQAFAPLRLEEVQEKVLPLKEKGVYLITGGRGEIGLVLARYLAESFAARLILTGVSEFPPKDQWNHWLSETGAGEENRICQKIKKIKELEELGAEVLVFSADAAQNQDMALVIRQAEEHFGKINGVIHAAGITRRGGRGRGFNTLQNLSKTESQRQFKVKAQALLILDQLLKKNELDFFWVMSSVSSVLGGLEFGAYASANIFMDSYVNYGSTLNYLNPPNSRPLPMISVNWDAMAPTDTVNTFQRILSLCKGNSDINQVVVSSGGNLRDRIHKWVKLEDLQDNEPGRNRDLFQLQLKPRPHLLEPYEEPGTELEQTIAAIWQRLFGFDKIGTRDDFFELGGDSLKAILLVSKLRKEFTVEVSLTKIFEMSTVRDLAQYIKNARQTDYREIEATEKKEYYPLSSAQKRMSIFQQLDPGDKSYNTYRVLEINGDIDMNALSAVFARLIARHEILRTSFELVHDEMVQLVHEQVDFQVEYFPLEKGADQDQQEAAAKQILRGFIRPFALDTVPLIRVGLIERSKNHFTLMLDIHHRVIDAVSMNILIRDFTALYKGESLVELHLQYKDFACWQNKLLQSGEIKRQEAYWLNRFKGSIPDVNIPVDYPRRGERSTRAGTLNVIIRGEWPHRLEQLALQTETTLFMVLTAAVNILIAKYTHQEDIIIGLPIEGRNHDGLEHVLGMFVNMLALRNFPQPGKTFKKFLKEVRENLLNAYDNQDYPFEELVTKLKIKREPGKNPLFNFSFAMANLETDIPEAPGFEIAMKPYSYHDSTARFDLTLFVHFFEGELSCSFRYAVALFKKETIQRIVDHYKEILYQILENPGLKLEDIEISSHLIKAEDLTHEEEIDFSF